jgi:hypothetical protein
MSEPRPGYEFIKSPTPEEAAANVLKTMKQYPFLTHGEALRLNVCRALAECSMVYSNSSGGGRKKNYLDSLRRKYNQEMPW